MPLRVVTPPASEPVTLAEAKAHLRLEESVDDVLVQGLITAARQYIEKICWRAALTQTLELELPSFRGEDKLELPMHFGIGGGDGYSSAVGDFSGGRFKPYIELHGGHLADVPALSVVYLDTAGVEQTLAPVSYVVQGLVNEQRNARLWQNDAGGYSWPSTLDRFDAVRIRYTVGWSASKFPVPLRQSILLLISQMYEHRTPQVTESISATLEFTIDALTSPYRLLRL